MFSSCLETIEPEGLADLRGAKAELLRAQTSLQAANAAKVEAEAALVMAQAKVQEAIAKQQEALALKMQYEAELVQAQNEAEKIAIANRIAELEAQALITAENLKASLINAQAATARAQAEYEKALKDLAIAKNTLTPEQLAAIGALENAVVEGRNGVEEKTVALEEAAAYLAEVLAELDSPKMLALAIKSAELEIVKAQSELEAYKVAEAKAKALLELDPAVADWDAQVEAIDAEFEAIRLEVAKHAAEKAEATAALSDSLEIVEALAAQYTAYTGYELLETGYFSKVKGEATDPEVVIPGEIVVVAPVDAEGNSLFGGDFVVGTVYNYGEEADFVKQFEDKVKQLNKTYTVEAIEAQMKVNEEYVKELQNNLDHKQLLTMYNDAVAAYKAGDVVPFAKKYVWDEDEDVNVSLKAYDEALKAFMAAVETYETEAAKHVGPDQDAYEAIGAAYDEAIAAAAAVKAKAYHDAYNTYQAAWVVYNKAQTVYNNAVANYEAVLNATERAAGVSYAEMKAFIETYGSLTTDEDIVKQVNEYKAYVATIEKAAVETETEDDKDAQSVWNAAVDAYDKAWNAYEKARSDADYAYEVAEAAADNTAENAYREYYAADGAFDYNYFNYLAQKVDEAGYAVEEAASDVADFVDANYVDFEYEYAENRSFTFWIPEYFVEETLTADNQIVASFATVTVADLYDLEEFKNETIAYFYDELTSVRVDYSFEYTDDYRDFYRHYMGWIPINYSDYSNASPLELPTAEEFAEFVDGIDYYPAWIMNYYNNLKQQYVWAGDLEIEVTASSMYYETVAALEAEDLKAELENLKKLPDFVKAIEAAKAEVEAFMAEKTAEVEEMKATVEAFMLKVNELMDSLNAQLEVLLVKLGVLEGQYDILTGIIESYTDGYETVAEFTKALEEAYYEAVEATLWAEANVIYAEQDLADLKAGVASAADWAQRMYDRAAEELAEAIAKLERAAKSLENVLAAIYGEATGETPVVPEGGDDTTEGGEETPAE